MESKTNFPQFSVPGQPLKIEKENEQKIMKITIYGYFYHVPVRKSEHFPQMLCTIILWKIFLTFHNFPSMFCDKTLSNALSGIDLNFILFKRNQSISRSLIPCAMSQSDLAQFVSASLDAFLTGHQYPAYIHTVEIVEIW